MNTLHKQLHIRETKGLMRSILLGAWEASPNRKVTSVVILGWFCNILSGIPESTSSITTNLHTYNQTIHLVVNTKAPGQRQHRRFMLCHKRFTCALPLTPTLSCVSARKRNSSHMHVTSTERWTQTASPNLASASPPKRACPSTTVWSSRHTVCTQPPRTEK